MKALTQIIAVISCGCFLFISENTMAQEKVTVPVKGTYRNMYEMLKNVPGLQVNSTNGRGGITVRGTGTLTSPGQPLIVVNGSVYDGDIGDLNPEDVESVTVLKDAASQTAYGARGAMGVIVITFKKGQNGGTDPPVVTSYKGSAYTYFIEHKTPLKVFDMNDAVMFEGVIQKQKGDTLVFIKKRKDFLVAISSIKRVEMIPIPEQ